MQLRCCFCGEVIRDDLKYRMVIQKDSGDDAGEAPTQELYCHEACLEERLHDPKWLYLKYL